MKFYQELTLIDDVEISVNFLWTKLFGQIHIALADVANQHGIKSIGVSFPNYINEPKRKSLGNKLRIFAESKAELEMLNIEKWLENYIDYVHIRKTNEVPKHDSFLLVSRYDKKNINKAAQCLANHKNISLAESLEHCKKYKRKIENVPFMRLYSLTNQRDYYLFINQKVVDVEAKGDFSTYGLSKVTTVPNF